jgi:drug/metabolite transporter (DMT)-like permease
MMSERAKGVWLMLGASVCFSTAGVVVRHIETVGATGIVFWRSVFMSVFLAALLATWHRGALPARMRAAGRPGLVSALFLAATFFFFIFSISYTTVANASALMSTGPLFLAAAAWAFLGERPRAGTWAAIAAALAGIALMFSEGLETGQLAGNLLALAVPASFTINYIVLRRAAASVDPTVAALIAALLSVLAAAPLAWPLAASGRDLLLLAALGVFQTGLGLALMTRAYHRLQAGELALVGLLEPVLAPLWVWLAIGERPGNAALAGGVIVIGAVLANQLLALRPRPAKTATAAVSRSP